MAITPQEEPSSGLGNVLARRYTYFTIFFILFAIVIGLLESAGAISNNGIGYLFLLLTMGLYAGIGIMSATKNLDEYYVAGRAVPAIANGMATGADWMSAASFISIAGTLWLFGISHLAAGLFGMIANFALAIGVSLLIDAPALDTERMVDSLRQPDRSMSCRRSDRARACPEAVPQAMLQLLIYHRSESVNPAGST